MRSYVSVFNGDSDQGTSGMTQFEDEVGHIRRQLRGGKYHTTRQRGWYRRWLSGSENVTWNVLGNVISLSLGLSLILVFSASI